MGRRQVGPGGDLACDYIEDTQVYRAVCCALRMMRRGESPGGANVRAARTFRVDPGEVARLTGQHAARVKEALRG